MEIYLDHAATAALSDSMKEYLISILDQYANPSSFYSAAEGPKQIISESRQSVAEFIHADPQDIYFTPSGSASNTLAIRGYYTKHDCTVLYSPIAHKSVLNCVKSLKKACPLKVDDKGFIDFNDLREWLDTHSVNPFAVIDFANSETGTIQNVKHLIDLIHFYNGKIYLDCTGSVTQIPIDVKSAAADMLGFSGHKLGSLKGCGVLYKKADIELEPLIYGSQEGGIASGTENVLGIASLGKAVKEYDYSSVSPAGRDQLYDYIMNHIPDSYLIGASIEYGNRLPHNLYMCFIGVEGQSLMMMLDMNGIQVSTGSACNSRNLTASAALSAIGINKADIHSCIRFTFSGRESKAQIDYVCSKVKECVGILRKLNP